MLATAICLIGPDKIRAWRPLERSISSSRQFIVYGTDAQLRGALCDVAEQTKSRLLALLQKSDAWQTPIVINARFPEANLPELPAASLRFSQTGFGLKLQLDLTVGRDVEAALIEREILRVVLLEMTYRTRLNLPAGTFYTEPPPWLIEGVLTQGRELTHSRSSLQLLVAAHKIVALADFLQQRPELLDSPSREIYNAYSAALLTRLVDSPDGNTLLAKFIFDLPDASNDALKNLRSHFPILGGSDITAENIWQAGVAQFASLEDPHSLSVAASERQLDELLQRPVDDHLQILDYVAATKPSPGRAIILNQLNDELMRLGSRAHPLYRPIIFEYQKITAGLARGKTFHIARRLAQLKESRQGLLGRMRAIDDYMNWFEATQAQTRSGNFTDYLKDADQPASEMRRHDPVSVYLDALESQLQN